MGFTDQSKISKKGYNMFSFKSWHRLKVVEHTEIVGRRNRGAY